MDWCTLGATSNKNSAANMKNQPLTPEQRIKELEVQLLEAQQKAMLFEEVVRIIRTEYPNPLIKKPLGNCPKPQSRKSDEY